MRPQCQAPVRRARGAVAGGGATADMGTAGPGRAGAENKSSVLGALDEEGGLAGARTAFS